MSVPLMPLSKIPLITTPARAVLIGAVPVRLVLLPLDGGGFSALSSGFNIQVLR